MENNETFITKWEYRTQYEYVGNHSKTTSLNDLGQQGWEAVGIEKNGQVLFKRPCGKIRVQEKQKEPQYINR